MPYRQVGGPWQPNEPPSRQTGGSFSTLSHAASTSLSSASPRRPGRLGAAPKSRQAHRPRLGPLGQAPDQREQRPAGDASTMDAHHRRGIGSCPARHGPAGARRRPPCTAPTSPARPPDPARSARQASTRAFGAHPYQPATDGLPLPPHHRPTIVQHFKHQGPSPRKHRREGRKLAITADTAGKTIHCSPLP